MYEPGISSRRLYSFILKTGRVSHRRVAQKPEYSPRGVGIGVSDPVRDPTHSPSTDQSTTGVLGDTWSEDQE